MEDSRTVCNETIPHSNINEPEFIVTTIVLGILNVMVVFGNSLVIAAVFTFRKLRTVTNMFIVSLAVADLLLGIVILPFSIADEVLDYWIFGTFLCTIWLAVDVWLSTASILNLCAISLDRYLAITEPIKYPNLMCPKRARALIATVWVFSFVICLPPLLDWRDPGSDSKDVNITSVSDALLLDLLSFNDWNMTEDSTFSTAASNEFENCFTEVLPSCELVSERGYRIYSAMGSFYIPMLVMVFFYLRIYLAAVRTAASLRRGVLTTKTHDDMPANDDGAVTLRVHRGATSRQNARYECSVRFSNKANKNHNGNQAGQDKKRSSRQTKTTTTERDVLLLRGKGKKRKRHSNTNETEYTSEAEICSLRDSTTSSKNSVSEKGNKLKVPKENCENKVNGKTERLCLQDDESNESRRRSHFTFKGTAKRNLKHVRKFKRETKAAKTLAIIVGAFILCWFPFFTVYLIGAFCDSCIAPLLFDILFWLGYCNSAINPCVYALFSRDFRQAFKRLLWCSNKRPETQNRFQAYGQGVPLQSQIKDSESLSES